MFKVPQVVKIRQCKYCKISFNLASNVFSNHVRWCDKRKRDDSKFNKSVEERVVRRRGENKSFTVNCFKCKKNFEVIEREKDFPLKEKYFCTISCANSKTRTEESKRQQGFDLYVRKGITCKVDYLNCLHCNKLLVNKQFCTREHRTLYSRRNLTEKRKYSLDCDFNFALKDYPEEFDFTVIEKFGWYKASNYKDSNTNGVSRDHIYSICDGFKNRVDSKIISHPANCNLVRHDYNFKIKNRRSDITLEDLLIKISEWDKKYK